MMKIDTTAFEKAIASLGRAVSRAQGSPNDEELRDAVIQRFEYTMDLSWKLIQYALKNADLQDSAILTKRDLFREGARRGWIVNPITWFEYYKARNETSHAYNVEVAQRVFQRAIAFLPESKTLCEKLQKEKND
jgi:nucleotidyltransferase substrate binding protein (TIGR01987 family)